MDNEDHFFTIPEALISAANQLAMVVGYSPADAETFGPANTTDADENLYQARNIWASSKLFDVLQAPLQRPAWDVGEVIDMDAATFAQSSLVLSSEAILADPTKIVAIRGISGTNALSVLGLTLVLAST